MIRGDETMQTMDGNMEMVSNFLVRAANAEVSNFVIDAQDHQYSQCLAQ